MKIPNKSKEKIESQVTKIVSNYNIVSVGEIIPIFNNYNINYDILNGIFTNKIINFDMYMYFIYEIEYVDYDILLYKNNNKFKSAQYRDQLNNDNFINCFFLSNKNVKINIVPYDYSLMIPHPIKFLQFENNKSNLHWKIVESYYKRQKKAILTFLNNIEPSKTNFLCIIGTKQNGINYICRKIADKYGYYFFTKKINHIYDKNEVVNYIKKREFFFPSFIFFKNCNSNLVKSFFDDELIAMMKMKRKMMNNFDEENKEIHYNNIFIFHFENLNDIPSNLKEKAEIITFPSLKVNDKINIIKELSLNFIEKLEICLKKQINLVNFAKLHLSQKNDINQPIDFSKINNTIQKYLLNLSLKDIKNALIQSYVKLAKSFSIKQKLTIENTFFEEISQTYLSKEKNKFADKSISISSIPSTKWSDIGGLDKIKEEVHDIITLPTTYPNLFSSISLRKRSGLLLYGPPGTGKTLIAKAIANESIMNFISVKGPELLNMYVGESEKNIKNIFLKAKMNSPCVLFFDEIDSLCPTKSKNSDQSNVIDRIVSQFMVEMDEINNDNDNRIIIIGATNRVDLIEPSLLRPGRFDKSVYVDIPRNYEEKLSVFKIHTKNLDIDKSLNEKEIVDSFKEGYSGADIYEICTKAFVRAFKRMLSMKAKKEKQNVLIQKEDFIEAISGTNPSGKYIESKN